MAKTTQRTQLALVASASVLCLTAGCYAFHATAQRRKKSEKKERDVETTKVEESAITRTIPNEIHLGGETSNDDDVGQNRILARHRITIAHGSVTGSCAKMALELKEKLETTLKSPKVSIQVGRVDEWDWWDELLNPDDDDDDDDENGTTKSAPPMVLLVLPTHSEGTWSVPSQNLHQSLQDLAHDWRIEKRPLAGLKVAIFGMGSSAYDIETMGKPAKEAMRYFKQLGAQLLTTVAIGDDAVGNHAKETFQQWMGQLVPKMEAYYEPASSSCGCGQPASKDSEGCCQSNSNNDVEDEEYPSDDEEEVEPEVMDLEDMGSSLMKSSTQSSNEPREMVTPSQAVALKKEGYKLIGTHSAVKLCRWTKHQLRGRGGCYKHTFYGITSYQCMEATPSLACANKCVFCWRHHKNPVGKEWTWKTDDPYMIVDEAVKTHVKMIKEAKGIPGVKMDRWQEAHTVRHCALSLVGEPIMYPRIDELLGELHNRAISTFLVTNGQHPSAIGSIRPITQLYVSVDAPTPESLIAIDRPLFQDAWERLQQSLSMLKEKGQRTVARLTVVKGWNSDEIGGYAKLIALGHVSLVEIKGVTFCGKSDASNLNMSNTPWHHEVVQLTTKLQEELAKLREQDQSIPLYGLACEHKHSVSVLLARVDQFAVVDPITGDRRWRTWIDYDKFQALAAKNAADPSFTFSVEEYVTDTPTWALFGAQEEGFDPTDTRHRKKKKHPKYTQFDSNGVPTHDDNKEELSQEERTRLKGLMEQKLREVGSGTTVTELKGGEKQIADASLMFRGLTIVK